MWIADNWKDYEVIDTSDGEKLERWGDYILVRPDPQVIWDTPKKAKGWKKMNGHYHRSNKGGGEWEFFNLPNTWQIKYGKLVFNLQPFKSAADRRFRPQIQQGLIRHSVFTCPRRRRFLYSFGVMAHSRKNCLRK